MKVVNESSLDCRVNEDTEELLDANYKLKENIIVFLCLG